MRARLALEAKRHASRTDFRRRSPFNEQVDQFSLFLV